MNFALALVGARYDSGEAGRLSWPPPITGRKGLAQGCEPGPTKYFVEIPGARQEHCQSRDRQPGEDRIEPRRMVAPPAQQRPQPASDFQPWLNCRPNGRGLLESGNLTVDD